jgi:hypothetical protein
VRRRAPQAPRRRALRPAGALRIPGAVTDMSLARLRRLVARCDRISEALEEQALRVAVIRMNAQKRIDALEERERPASGRKAAVP